MEIVTKIQQLIENCEKAGDPQNMIPHYEVQLARIQEILVRQAIGDETEVPTLKIWMFA